jgi:gas vesicle protein
MGESTRELRRDIEDTREHLGATLDTIGERVSPGRIVARRTQRLKDRVTSVKDAVMGTAESVQESVGSGAHTVADQASSAAGAVVEEARQAPAQVRHATQGNPLAAGMVAFGLGMVVASLFPASEPERRAASAVTDRLEPLKDQALELGSEMKDTVQTAAQEAAREVKSTARDAAHEVQDQARTAASDVKDEAKAAAYEVKDDVERGGNGHGNA